MKRILFSLFFFLSSLIAENEPLALYLTWKEDPSTSIEVLWITAEKGEKDQIEVDGVKFEGQHRALPGLPLILHQVSLKNLKPDTLYSFNLLGGETLYQFKTLPKRLDQPFKFVVGGDCYHDDIEPFFQMFRAIGKQGPSFVVLGGDLAYSYEKKTKPERPERWITFLGAVSKELKTPDGLIIPILPVIGNHDVQGSFGQTPEAAVLFYTLFPSLPMGYGELDVGNFLSLFMLDSNHTHPIEGKQTSWLKEALSCKEEIPYRFAVYHVPAFPSVRPYLYRYSQEIRKNWVPLFEQFHLMGVFEHHDHALKRTYPLFEKRIDRDKGVVYFGDGSCGTGEPRKPKEAGTVWYLEQTKQAQAVWVVTLTKEKALFEAISSKGAVLDRTEIIPTSRR